MPFSLWMWTLLGLEVFTAAWGAEEAVTLRYRWTPQTVLAVEVQSDYTQTVLAPGEAMAREQVSMRGTELWHVREVQGNVATLDRFSAEVEEGAPAGTERENLGLDLGSGPPLGYGETLRRNDRGQVLEYVPVGPEDPFGAFRAVLVQAADTFPEGPVRPGDTWMAEAEAPWGPKGIPVRWRGEVCWEPGEENPVLLRATLRSRVRNVPLAPRMVIRRQGEKRGTVEVEDQIRALSGEATRALHFDPVRGQPVRIEEQVDLQMEVLQTVRAESQTLTQRYTIAVTRRGKTVRTFRSPTDEELIRIIALALANGLERHDADLLFSFHDPTFTGPDGDLEALRARAEALFQRFPLLKVLCSQVQASLGPNTGLLTFHRQVFASENPAGPLQPAAEGEVRLHLRRDPTRWVVVGAE